MGHRLPNKSNPYVGWFRHAPATSFLQQSRFNGKRTRSFQSSLNMKNSPYIGWFRHAPPSCLDLTTEQLNKLDDEFEALFKRMSDKSKKDLSCYFVSGHLKGGAPGSYVSPRNAQSFNSQSFNSQSFNRSLQESTEGAPSATLKILTRLASWFLFPLALDVDSCSYSHSHDDKLAVFPHLFPAANRNSLLEEDQSSSCHSISCHDSEDDSLDTVPDVFPHDLQVPDEMDISVSSLAEAYYAHQADKEIDHSVYAEIGEDRQRLDYVITQMDIARMARNASRHLDVASILSLPTITFRSMTPPPSQEADEDPGWSWMIVHDGINEQDSPKEDDTAVCVICLEHFVDGDRLRVLPCDHSFHVGCIDRWLSGSHSYQDCFTSGCPTCKKRPDTVDPPSDGSVPAWAFTRIGESLANNTP